MTMSVRDMYNKSYQKYGAENNIYPKTKTLIRHAIIIQLWNSFETTKSYNL